MICEVDRAAIWRESGARGVVLSCSAAAAPRGHLGVPIAASRRFAAHSARWHQPGDCVVVRAAPRRAQRDTASLSGRPGNRREGPTGGAQRGDHVGAQRGGRSAHHPAICAVPRASASCPGRLVGSGERRELRVVSAPMAVGIGDLRVSVSDLFGGQGRICAVPSARKSRWRGWRSAPASSTTWPCSAAHWAVVRPAWGRRRWGQAPVASARTCAVLSTARSADSRLAAWAPRAAIWAFVMGAKCVYPARQGQLRCGDLRGGREGHLRGVGSQLGAAEARSGSSTRRHGAPMAARRWSPGRRADRR